MVKTDDTDESLEITRITSSCFHFFSTLQSASTVEFPMSADSDACVARFTSDVEINQLGKPLVPCVITVKGKTYDLTNWANSHPGGPIIHIYHNHDCTNVFDAFHGAGAYKLLDQFPSKEAKLATLKDDSDCVKPYNGNKPVCPKTILKDFDEFRKELEKDGLFNSSLVWFPFKFLTTVAFLPLAYVLNMYGYYTLSAFFLGVMWQQLGWVSHELLHHSVFDNRALGRGLGWVSGPVLLGFSRFWWNERHNAHHAATNITGADPDIDNLPFLAWSRYDVDRAPANMRTYMQYQQYYFWAILPFLNVIWALNSVNFVKDIMTSSPYKAYKSHMRNEAIGLALHYTWLSCFLWFTLPSVWVIAWYIFVSKMVGGAFLAFVVFFNHYSCPKIDFGSDAGENFVIMQLISTRNLTPGVFTDWFCGGLNYQVEHHLFPTMPRQNLNACSHRLKKFCADHNLPYLCSDFGEGLGFVKEYLTNAATYATSLVNAEVKASGSKKSN